MIFKMKVIMMMEFAVLVTICLEVDLKILQSADRSLKTYFKRDSDQRQCTGEHWKSLFGVNKCTSANFNNTEK